MPPKRGWIDKKTATTYQLFHRSQNDPLIHDPEADDRVLHQVSGPSHPPNGPRATRHLGDLEREFAQSGARKNEGEAANYGIFYDDSEYDYMQHLRELGKGGGEAHFIEASARKGKGKMKKLEDALAESGLEGDFDGLSLRDASSTYGGDDMLSTASSYVRKPTYQDQQDVPDAIAGFQPDMDPRLREVLEALEDEAFVDEEGEEDVFDALVEGGIDAEVDPDEWRDTYIEDDDEGWDSDATEKAPVQPMSSSTSHKKDDSKAYTTSQTESELPSHDAPIPDATNDDGDWLKNFAKYKKDMKSRPSPTDASENASELRTTASTLFTVGGTPIRKKKRKGALTNPSAYSMTSSSLARTEGLRLLDDRFERVEALYALDEGEEYEGSSMADDVSIMSGMSKYSQTPSMVSQSGNVPMREDFDSVMDEFLGGWQDRGKQAKRKGAKGKRGKNGNEVAGMRMLDEIRQGLGTCEGSGRV
ncbi:ribosome biogenesis protein Ltv1 [Coccidioides immitis RMSCC 2394]|uniref:Ribosome biogenesis protein Ltv1 n=1 Tax=Coccidioides immitis RMSCC 2394 TaxID=404692 RepID=A0A0J7B007_COCIT|nr:ribosome biogenesis protein Ltv1 [Coccidioides immitis RMSCC 2394]